MSKWSTCGKAQMVSMEGKKYLPSAQAQMVTAFRHELESAISRANLGSPPDAFKGQLKSLAIVQNC